MTESAPKPGSSYRDILSYYYDTEIGSVVGCGLDRAGGRFTVSEQDLAIQYYRENEEKFKKFAIGERRQIIADLMQTGLKRDGFI